MTMDALLVQEPNKTHFSVAKNKTTAPLRECVRDAMTGYLKQLGGHTAANIYQMVLAEVEQPLLETVMTHTEGNQTRAAEMLGISRSTLRKKLALYDLD
ncbi:DNA-binding transcriptional regulator Fis [Sedimenticola thiotaurini]|uniref:DNA-binding transcriptional regulator Fis n=1 Tax=Sedimenticola thiotaurini TaxID=1543721 RepID=UPI000B29CED0|nr:DNA-binding transcriptional regulator Fis [Sedimenticola thiotaurini]